MITIRPVVKNVNLSVESQWTHLCQFSIDLTSKVSRCFINYERRIHLEILISIRRGQLDVDSTYKIDEISMSFLRVFFSDVVSILS